MFSDSQLLPISALQHLLYCERQCALIHVEQLWAENRFTVEGRHLHARADAGRGESRGGVHAGRAVAVWSYALGLIGKADVVEFRPRDPAIANRQSDLDELSRVEITNLGTPFPIEYKRGKPKPHDADRVQLCAQALCLEEMLAVKVEAGALFYGRTRRRCDVTFDENLRELTRKTAARLHELLGSGQTPPAVYEKKKCESCSLINLCLPKVPGRAQRYLDRAMADALATAIGPASD